MIRLFFKFKALLSQSNWNPVLECHDTNIATAEFMKIYNYAFNEAFQLVRLLRKKSQQQEVLQCWPEKKLANRAKII